MAILDLTGLNWTVEGWRPFSWKLGKSMETGFGLKADIDARPMRVPGTVQAALRDAGVIPDWNIGFNSRECEWVEHRHWLMETVIPAGTVNPGETVILEAESLDYWGWILVDCAEAARFEQVLTDLRGGLEKAQAALEGARRVAANTPEQLEAARAAEQQAAARYRAGLGTLVEVADATRLLTQAEIDDALARLNVWRALLGVAAARGDRSVARRWYDEAIAMYEELEKKGQASANLKEEVRLAREAMGRLEMGKR